MKKSRTVIRRRQSESPALRHLPLVDILVDAQAELQELVVQSGLKVLEAILEEDRVAVCGPRYAHPPERRASRAGHAPSEVVLGGRTVALRRPRVRHAGQEVALPTFRAFAADDPLNRRVVEQMLVGVATRQYGRSLEPLGPDVRTRGTSKRAVSWRFVAQTQAQLDAWRATPLADLDLAVLLLDGVHVGHHCSVVSVRSPHVSFRTKVRDSSERHGCGDKRRVRWRTRERRRCCRLPRVGTGVKRMRG